MKWLLKLSENALLKLLRGGRVILGETEDMVEVEMIEGGISVLEKPDLCHDCKNPVRDSPYTHGGEPLCRNCWRWCKEEGCNNEKADGKDLCEEHLIDASFVETFKEPLHDAVREELSTKETTKALSAKMFGSPATVTEGLRKAFAYGKEKDHGNMARLDAPTCNCPWDGWVAVGAHKPDGLWKPWNDKALGRG